jgi:hypothetical protein
MDPKKENLQLVEYFDMQYVQVKPMPPQYQRMIDNFNFSFDIRAAACRQRVFFS